MTERARTTQPWLAWGLAVLAASCVAVIAAWRLSPPGDEGTNEASFSGARALAYSAHVVGNLPHMVASPENRAVKRRLLHELGSKTATTQRGTVCGSHGSCALVENVLFRLEGANPSREIVVAAHYDSVAAGIGAGDDGSGVGILLELKRVLERQGPLPHPVTLLFTDGEELGLLGAELYARNLKDDAVERIALNVEARGTSGASLLFDLADPDAAILQRVAPALTRTFTSSLFPLVYQKLPNDTDLTALRRANIRGIGFAFIGRVDKYHTSDDDHASVSVASVHHQGRSVYEATQALLDPRPLHRVDQLEVFFDVLGFRLVQLSVAGARILALLALFVFVAGVLRARHTGALSARDLGRGVFAVVLGLALAGACGGGLEWVWRYTGALPGPFLAKQGHGYIAVLAVAAVATHTASMATRAAPAAKLFGAFGLFCILAAVTAFMVPQACFLFLVPACVSAITVLFGTSPRALQLSAVLFALASTALWAPLALLLCDAIGLTSPLVLTLVLATSVTPVASALPTLRSEDGGRRHWMALALAWGCVLAAVGSFVFADNYSTETKQRVNVALEVDADTGQSRWLVDAQFGPVPPAWSDAFGLVSASDCRAFLGRATRCQQAPAHAAPLQAPAWTVLEAIRLDSARVRLVLELRSLRGAHLLSLFFDPSQSVFSIRVNDMPASMRPTTSGSLLALAHPPDVPLRVELVVPAGPFEMQLTDHTAGFGAQTLPAPRPSEAVASQWGDSTAVVRRIRIGLAGPGKSR